MFSILFVEGLKWKRSKMLWVIATAILLPGLLTLGLVWGAFNHGRETVWESLFTNHFGVFNLLFAPAVFMLLMGFLFAREHQEHTINALFTYPQPRWKWFFGKMMMMFPFVLFIYLGNFLIVLIIGGVFAEDILTVALFWDKGLIVSKTMLAQLSLVPVAALIGIVGRNNIASALFGTGVVMINAMLLMFSVRTNTLFCFLGSLSFAYF